MGNQVAKMTEVNLDIKKHLEKIKPAFEIGTPRIVSFHTATFRDGEGDSVNLAIKVRIEDGDVYGILRSVAENGGIGAEDDDGVYRFIPWPCTAVLVREA